MLVVGLNGMGCHSDRVYCFFWWRRKECNRGNVGWGTVSADLVSGDANLLYCSEAISKQTSYLPLKIHRWAEMFL